MSLIKIVEWMLDNYNAEAYKGIEDERRKNNN